MLIKDLMPSPLVSTLSRAEAAADAVEISTLQLHVSTLSRAEAAAKRLTQKPKVICVSTLSRAEAAANATLAQMLNAKFQHSAARRRLPYSVTVLGGR